MHMCSHYLFITEDKETESELLSFNVPIRAHLFSFLLPLWTTGFSSWKSICFRDVLKGAAVAKICLSVHIKARSSWPINNCYIILLCCLRFQNDITIAAPWELLHQIYQAALSRWFPFWGKWLMLYLIYSSPGRARTQVSPDPKQT